MEDHTVTNLVVIVPTLEWPPIDVHRRGHPSFATIVRRLPTRVRMFRIRHLLPLGSKRVGPEWRDIGWTRRIGPNDGSVSLPRHGENERIDVVALIKQNEDGG